MITVKDREQFLMALKDLLPKKPIGVELGVLNGDFAELILDIVNPKKLDLVDPYTKNKTNYGDENSLTTAYSTEEQYKEILKRFYVQMLNRKVSIYRQYSFERVKYVTDNTLNFVYHDASHRHEDIKRDLNEWLPKMKQDSIIAGHDYIEDKDFGVIQAVNEFMEEHEFEMIIYNENGGDFALKIKA